MSAADHRTIPERFFHPTGVFREFPAEDLGCSIPELFARQVRRTPERLAVKTATGALTYAALDAISDRIARAIEKRRGRLVEPVAVLVERDAALAAVLGVLKAGKILVVLDPTQPVARNSAILRTAEAALVVTTRDGVDVAAMDGRDWLDVDEAAAHAGIENPRVSIPAEALAAIIFTSGTTGQPKGVTHDHRSLLHLVREVINAVRLTSEDRIPLLHSLTVIAGFRTVFIALLSGATLYPFDARREGLARLTSWLREEQISFYQSVPTMFREMISALGPSDCFPCLRAIRVGGDTVSRRDFELFRRHFGGRAAFLVTYGAAEVSTIAWFIADEATTFDGDVVPVGFAREGSDVLLLDEAGGPVAAGETGEIVVRSPYLSRGYWRRDDLTAERFRPDPDGGEGRLYRTGDLGRILPDGALVHLGRKDAQVKVRGFRVELAEIEAALLDDPAVEQAVVVARDQGREQSLAAYAVPAAGSRPSLEAIRRRLEARLPTHMVPSAIVLLEALPLTPNGKIARHALPAPPPNRPSLAQPYVPPRSPVEEVLVRIWEEALELEGLGVKDRFLDLGGTSLAATRITARLTVAFGRLEFDVSSILAAPTVAEMAVVVVDALAATMAPEALSQLLIEIDGPSSTRGA